MDLKNRNGIKEPIHFLQKMCGNPQGCRLRPLEKVQPGQGQITQAGQWALSATLERCLNNISHSLAAWLGFVVYQFAGKN
jgi:hypothetical protein